MADLGTIVDKVTTVTTAWLQDINNFFYRSAANSIKGNNTGGVAVTQDLTGTQVKAMLPTYVLASSDFANQGTTITVLHGNAAGNPSFGAIVAADLTAGLLQFSNFKSFTSTDQTITAAGALTIAHGLGVAPSIISIYLVNQTADAGYTAGQVLLVNPIQGQAGSNFGIAVVPDATNLNIRFGSSANMFIAPNNTTGASAALVSANWKIRFKALG